MIRILIYCRTAMAPGSPKLPRFAGPFPECSSPPWQILSHEQFYAKALHDTSCWQVWRYEVPPGCPLDAAWIRQTMSSIVFWASKEFEGIPPNRARGLALRLDTCGLCIIVYHAS